MPKIESFTGVERLFKGSQEESVAASLSWKTSRAKSCELTDKEGKVLASHLPASGEHSLDLSASVDLVLVCSDEAGKKVSQKLSIKVDPKAEILEFKAQSSDSQDPLDKIILTATQPSVTLTVSIQVSGLRSCTFDGRNLELGADGKASVQVTIDSQRTLGLDCEGDSDNPSKKLEILVESEPLVYGFSVKKNKVASNGETLAFEWKRFQSTNNCRVKIGTVTFCDEENLKSRCEGSTNITMLGKQSFTLDCGPSASVSADPLTVDVYGLKPLTVKEAADSTSSFKTLIFKGSDPENLTISAKPIGIENPEKCQLKLGSKTVDAKKDNDQIVFAFSYSVKREIKNAVDYDRARQDDLKGSISCGAANFDLESLNLQFGLAIAAVGGPDSISNVYEISSRKSDHQVDFPIFVSFYKACNVRFNNRDFDANVEGKTRLTYNNILESGDLELNCSLNDGFSRGASPLKKLISKVIYYPAPRLGEVKTIQYNDSTTLQLEVKNATACEVTWNYSPVRKKACALTAGSETGKSSVSCSFQPEPGTFWTINCLNGIESNKNSTDGRLEESNPLELHSFRMGRSGQREYPSQHYEAFLELKFTPKNAQRCEAKFFSKANGAEVLTAPVQNFREGDTVTISVAGDKLPTGRYNGTLTCFREKNSKHTLATSVSFWSDEDYKAPPQIALFVKKGNDSFLIGSDDHISAWVPLVASPKLLEGELNLNVKAEGASSCKVGGTLLKANSERTGVDQDVKVSVNLFSTTVSIVCWNDFWTEGTTSRTHTIDINQQLAIGAFEIAPPAIQLPGTGIAHYELETETEFSSVPIRLGVNPVSADCKLEFQAPASVQGQHIKIPRLNPIAPISFSMDLLPGEYQLKLLCTLGQQPVDRSLRLTVKSRSSDQPRLKIFYAQADTERKMVALMGPYNIPSIPRWVSFEMTDCASVGQAYDRFGINPMLAKNPKVLSLPDLQSFGLPTMPELSMPGLDVFRSKSQWLSEKISCSTKPSSLLDSYWSVENSSGQDIAIAMDKASKNYLVLKNEWTSCRKLSSHLRNLLTINFAFEGFEKVLGADARLIPLICGDDKMEVENVWKASVWQHPSFNFKGADDNSPSKHPLLVLSNKGADGETRTLLIEQVNGQYLELNSEAQLWPETSPFTQVLRNFGIGVDVPATIVRKQGIDADILLARYKQNGKTQLDMLRVCTESSCKAETAFARSGSGDDADSLLVAVGPIKVNRIFTDKGYVYPLTLTFNKTANLADAHPETAKLAFEECSIAPVSAIFGVTAMDTIKKTDEVTESLLSETRNLELDTLQSRMKLEDSDRYFSCPRTEQNTCTVEITDYRHLVRAANGEHCGVDQKEMVLLLPKELTLGSLLTFKPFKSVESVVLKSNSVKSSISSTDSSGLYFEGLAAARVEGIVLEPLASSSFSLHGLKFMDVRSASLFDVKSGRTIGLERSNMAVKDLDGSYFNIFRSRVAFYGKNTITSDVGIDIESGALNFDSLAINVGQYGFWIRKNAMIFGRKLDMKGVGTEYHPYAFYYLDSPSWTTIAQSHYDSLRGLFVYDNDSEEFRNQIKLKFGVMTCDNMLKDGVVCGVR